MAMKSPIATPTKTTTLTPTTRTTTTTLDTITLDGSSNCNQNIHEKTLFKSPKRKIQEKMSSSKTLTMSRNPTTTATTTNLKNRPDISFILGDMTSMDDDDEGVDVRVKNESTAIRIPTEIKTQRQQQNLMPVPYIPSTGKRRISGQSRSHDDETTTAAHEDTEELLEQRFGSVSPIFPEKSPSSRQGGMSALGAARAKDFRLKFRKSHTCGSLYAKCSCSPSRETAPPFPITSSAHRTERQPLAALPTAMHLSISPSNTEPPSVSSGLGNSLSLSSTKLLSGGSFSLSTTTTASAQLSRDYDDIDCGYDDVDAESYACNANSIVGEAQAIGTHIPLEPKTQILYPSAAKTIQSPPPRISSTPPAVEITAARIVSPTPPRQSQQTKPKRLFQSYSHPDTDFIFTDENKKPCRDNTQQQFDNSAVIISRGGKVEIKHPKRSSSPNIGHYQILDVAVHPEILVKISPKHSPSSDQRKQLTQSLPHSARSAQQRRRWLQRSNEVESGGSTSESEKSFDITRQASTQQTVSQSEVEPLLAKSPVSPVSPVVKLPISTTAVRPQSPCMPSTTTSAAAAAASATTTQGDKSFNAAQRYFAESGILGPINTSSNLIRKTSKILQDTNVIEQIRKTSMILRGNTAAAIQKKLSTASTPPAIFRNTTTSSSSSTPSSPPLSLLTPAATATATTTTALSTPQLYSNNNNDNMELPTSLIYAQAAAAAAVSSPKSPKSPKSPRSPHKIVNSCGFCPSLITLTQNNNDEHDDVQLKSLQGEIVSLKDVIKSRDAEIIKLRREIHKLKSVLQQTTNHIPIAHDDLLQPTPKTQLQQQCNDISSSSSSGENGSQQTCICCRKKLTTETAAQSSESNGSIDSIQSDYQTCNSSTPNSSNGNGNSNSLTSASTTAVTCALATATNGGDTRHNSTEALDEAAAAIASSNSLSVQANPKPKVLQMVNAPVLKKQGVSGESCETSKQQSVNEPIPKYDKDFSSKQLIKDAIMDNDFLKNIDSSQVRELVESMYSLSVAKGEFVVREGEVGAHLYVSASGEFEVVKNGKVLGIMGPGKAFGELAILYNCTRTASIRVLADASLWVLDRRVFQQIMMRTGMQRIENSVNFLKSVPLLKNLSVEVLAKIADVLEVEFYAAGTYIIRQGASGDTFFLISQGTVKVTQKFGPTTEEKEIRLLERGDYFGEQALINEDKRTANIIAMAPGVECLTLDRDSFTHLIGDLCELKEKNYGDESRVLAMKHAETEKEVFGSNVQQEFPDMKLTDLEVIATLGIGGFGRVELVKAYRDNRVDIFALKCLKKRHIVETKQEEHVYSERTIMLACNTPFICRLYRTFRDEKYVYMLLEACMGGEIWTMLRDRGSFDENATQFIIGCVLQAFEYLHSRGIIYRDLKPENLMLDERGYVKLVDFGFAKYIGNSNKTWTFCGTPEYVAPEIILNKGHDRAVDYWALGVLIHELLNGTPPFTANDPMKTYNIILKGIDMIVFPKHMTRSAVQLIKKLCRDVPAERLGYQKGGIQDIKKHKWFLGFDWDGLESQLLIPPFVRPIAHPTDTCYFDRFPCDPNEPPDEFSGWDADF